MGSASHINFDDLSMAHEELTTQQAAIRLGCSEGWLIKLRGLGDGPPYYRRWKRKGIYYLATDLEAWRRGRRYLSTSEY